MYQKFLTQKMVFVDTQWAELVWKGLFALMFLPFIIGFALLDFKLLMLSGVAGAIAFYMMNKGVVSDSYQVSDKGWVRYITAKGATTDFSLNDCDEVIVRYQSNTSKGTRLSSDAAMMRDVLSRTLTDAMDVPELIPASVIFYRKADAPVLLPLRCMYDAAKNGIDSHQVEFFFALWLKERGFAFELQETDEMAGDWRAYRV